MKNLGVYCLMLVFCFLSLLTHAQETQMLDKLYLKNGQVIEGKIITFIPNELLAIRDRAGVETAYLLTDVLKVVQPTPPVSTSTTAARFKAPLIPASQRGWYNITEAGVLNGRTENDVHIGLSVSNTTGYLFKHWIGVGAGVGIDDYVPGAGEVIYPVFAEVRGYLHPDSYSLFYALRAGYGFALDSDDLLVTNAEGGMMYQPQVGYRIPTSSALQVLVTVGAKFQAARFERFARNRRGTEILTLTYQRITLGVGINF